MEHITLPSEPSPARKRLIQLMHDLNHGRITELEIVNGDPVFTTPPSVSRLIVFGKQNGQNPASNVSAIKRQIVELFSIFDRKQSFIIQELVVADGLPSRVTVAESVRA